MARHVRITGIVQGVGYRAAFAQVARTLHLSGWVRNCNDGAVEALVAGAANDLDQIVAWAWQGPASAQVASVTVTDAGDVHASGTFQILPTAQPGTSRP